MAKAAAPRLQKNYTETVPNSAVSFNTVCFNSFLLPTDRMLHTINIMSGVLNYNKDTPRLANNAGPALPISSITT